MKRSAILFSVCLGVGVLLAAGTGRAGERRRRRPRRVDNSPKVGALAPDFELDRLEDVLDKKKDKKDAEKTAGKAPPKPQKVKLSSFRGKQPVVLIFGSYT